MITSSEYNKLWELISPVKTGMLANWTGEMLHARPMQHVNSDLEEGILYFFTSDESGKALEIDHYNDVCITYSNISKSEFVSISATAEIVKDKVLIDKYWNAFVAAWFPEGKSSPNVSILKLHVYSAEYWDSVQSKTIQLFKILKANLTHTIPDMGENKALGVVA